MNYTIISILNLLLLFFLILSINDNSKRIDATNDRLELISNICMENHEWK